jgi:iron(III) transport system substrate-binding protein
MLLLLALCLGGCGQQKETVVVYTSMEDYRVAYLNQRLREEFPDYNVIVEYLPTGNHAARLLAEGKQSECDITHNLEYGYLMKLEEAGLLADLSGYDASVYVEDAVLSSRYLPQERNGGAIIVNTQVLAQRGLSEPTSYADLLKPEYKGLISMPSPKASGTGYMFLKALVNAWGEAEALAYFDALTENILQYTSSGSGPLNAVIQGEAAIGLGMTAPAVTQLNAGQPLKLIFFTEGSPYSLYGQGIVSGKEASPAVKAVFDFLVNQFTAENCERYFPEKLYKDKDYAVQNYPQQIPYADMSNNSLAEKTRLLNLWKY